MMKGILKLLTDIKPQLQGIYLIGDILDMNSLSFHDKGQSPIELPSGERIDLSYEYNEARKVFDNIDSVAKRVKKYFVYGNHEDRYNRTLNLADNKKYGKELRSPEEALKLRERGYEVKTRWKEDYFLIGDHLQAFHGEVLGVNPAKRQLDKLRQSCIFAHSHRVGTHFQGSKASFNIGWGGDISAPAFNYVGRLTKMDWINGFALVTTDDNGFFHTQVITVYDNKFYYNGKKYGG